jgi:hypothetical protein
MDAVTASSGSRGATGDRLPRSTVTRPATPPDQALGDAPIQPGGDLPAAPTGPPVHRASVLHSRANRITAVVAAGALASACVYTAMVDPNTSGAYPQCPLRLLTGVDCAMCGGMRATHAMLGGDVMRAASQNLLLVVLAPFALWATAQWFGAQWGVRVPPLPTRRWMAPALLVVAVVFSVVRNLGFGPGPWLHSDSF